MLSPEDLPQSELTLDEDDLRSTLLPILVGKIFHVTSRARFRRILADGHIKTNYDGSLGDTYPQSRVNVGRRRGWVCLFDLRNKSPQAIEWGLNCFYFLAPTPLGDDLSFLILGNHSRDHVVEWSTLEDAGDVAGLKIPEIECWFPRDLALSDLSCVLHVRVRRRPVDPDGLLALLLSRDKDRGS